MPTKQGSENSKSWQVQFRVNDGTDDGQEILKILAEQKRINPKLTDGDIYNEALLKFNGIVRPSTNLDKLLKHIERLERQIQDMPKLILAQIGPYLQQHGINPADYRRDDGTTLDHDIGELLPPDAQENFYNIQSMEFEDDDE